MMPLEQKPNVMQQSVGQMRRWWAMCALLAQQEKQAQASTMPLEMTANAMPRSVV
jgi:hypothetical protein